MASLFRKPQTGTSIAHSASLALRNHPAVRAESLAQQPELPPNELQRRLNELREIVSRRAWEAPQRQKLFQEIGQQVLSRSRVMQSPNFTVTNAADLQRMAEQYDRLFLEDHCLTIARHFGMQFRWSKRMTSTGGKTVRTTHFDRASGIQRTRYEIVLSAPLLFQTFGDLQRPIRVTGVLCTDRLQAMQRILEHEMIHLVEMLIWNDSCCAAQRFQSITGRLFGHTEHKHDLITQQERAARKFNIRVGSRVSFHHEGKRYIGTVNRITRRATVLVADASGTLYNDGGRYRKYYVPLSHLQPG